MTTAMHGQPITNVSPYGAYPFSFASQLQPFQQSQQQMPFGYGMSSQSQSFPPPLQQIVQAFAQQIGQLNQHAQQQSHLLHQLTQVVPQQLQQIQQFLQFLPQAIQQQSQIHQQPFGQAAGAFGPMNQPFGGISAWAGGGMPQQGTGGQTGVGGNLVGFPASGGQPGFVM